MKNRFFKRILCMLTLVSLVLGLVACKNVKTVYGELTDTVYFQQGDFKLTEKDLYDLMLSNKTSSSFSFVNAINEIVNQKVLAKYLEEVDQNWETEYKEKAQDLVKKSVYGTDEDEAIAKLSSTSKSVQIKQFLDSQLTKGIVADDIFADEILNSYKYQFATERFARQILEVEVTQEFVKDEDGEDTEEKNTYYIDDEAIEDYYDANYKGQNDFAVVAISFTNLNEAEQALQNKNVKSYKGELYYVPAGTNYNTIINEGNVSNYTKLTEKEVVLLFVQLYVELFPNTTITSSDLTSLEGKTVEEIVTELSTNEIFADFQKDYEDFKSENSALSSFVATKLKVENEENADVLPRYTATPASISNTYHLVYKLTDGTDKELNDELKAEIKEELIKNKLTTAYTNNKLALLSAEYTYSIFDGHIANVYESLGYELGDVKATENLLLSVKVEANEDLGITEDLTVTVSVKELYTKLEKTLGMTVAIEAAYKNALLSTTKYDSEITKDEMDDFKDAAKQVIKDFKNNSYSSYGLSSNVGEKTFLKLYFGLDNKDDLVEKYYKLNKRSELFLADMESNLKQNNNDYYETLAKYSQSYYEKYFSVSVGHVLVYTDFDLDGTPDNPETYTAEQKALVDEKAYELQVHFYEKAKNLVGKLNSSLEYLAKEFTKANKYDTTSYNAAGNTYGELKKLGFFAKYENLGNVTSDNYTSYDKVFAGKVTSLMEAALEENFDFEDDQEYLQKLTSVNDLAVSSFGYHMLILSKLDDKEDLSAKYTSDNDYGNSYKEIKYDEVVLDAYSENDYLSRNQIEIYMREKDLSSGIKNLPTDVKTACSTFVSPILTKYKSSTNQFFLKLSLLEGLDFTNDSTDTLLQLYKEYQVNTFFGYSLLNEHEKSPLATWFQDNYNFTIGGNN